MRRRKLFMLVAGASAVVCVGLCVLWVRSYWVADEWNWSVMRTRAGACTSRGELAVDVERIGPIMVDGRAINRQFNRPPAYRRNQPAADFFTYPHWRGRGYAGFAYVRLRAGRFQTIDNVLVPLWAPAVLL